MTVRENKRNAKFLGVIGRVEATGKREGAAVDRARRGLVAGGGRQASIKSWPGIARRAQ